MTHKDQKAPTPPLPTNFQIRVQGHLGPQWQAWFANGDTVISGPLVDQAALYGVLKKVRNLGLPLISVNPISLKQAQAGKDETNDETRPP